MNNSKSVFLLILMFFSFLVTPIFAQEKIDALVQYRNGRTLENQGKMDEAKALYQVAVDVCTKELQEKPNNIESYVVLTWSLLRMGRYNETIAECNKALKINANENRIIETKAEALFYVNNYTESLTCFEKYLGSANPNQERYSTAYFFVGEIYRLQHKYEHADIAYSRALQIYPGASLWWYRLGISRENSGNKAGAKVAYQQALKWRPNYPDATAALKRVQ